MSKQKLSLFSLSLFSILEEEIRPRKKATIILTIDETIFGNKITNSRSENVYSSRIKRERLVVYRLLKSGQCRFDYR